METRKRSLYKAISWRVIATFITSIVVWIVTDEPSLSIGIGLADSIIKMGAYYGHERMWTQIKLGLVPEKTKGVQGEGI